MTEFDPNTSPTPLSLLDPPPFAAGDPLNPDLSLFETLAARQFQSMPSVDHLIDIYLNPRSQESVDDRSKNSPSARDPSIILELVNNALGSTAINTTISAGSKLMTTGSELMEKTVGTSTHVAEGIMQQFSESVRDLMQAATDRWNAPDNSVHNALDNRISEMAGQIGDLAVRANQSRWMTVVKDRLDKASAWVWSLTESLYEQLGYYGSTGSNEKLTREEVFALDRAMAKVQTDLINFSQDPELISKLETTFGNQWSSARAKALFNTLTQGEGMPEIRVIPEGVLKADGGFGNDRIFLSDRLVGENVNNPDKITQVIIEEWAHSIDEKLNSTDSPGDEGDILARQVRGETISATELELDLMGK